MMGLDNNNGYDFFGVKKKSKANSNFSYLGNLGNPVKTNSQPLKLKTVNFIGNPQSLGPKSNPKKVVQYWGIKPLYKKESLRQKRLSKWGDVDMDGSPNYFDCDPVNFLKDAKKVNSKNVKKFTSANSKPMTFGSTEEYEAFVKKQKESKTSETKTSSSGKKSTKVKRKLTPEQAREKAEKILLQRYSGSGLLKGKKYAEAEMLYEESIEKGKVPKAKTLKKIAETRSRQIIRIMPGERKPVDIALEALKQKEYKKIEETQKKRGKKLADLQIKYRTPTEISQMTKGERIKYQRSVSAKAIEKNRIKRQRLLQEQKIESIVTEGREARYRVQPFRERQEAFTRGAISAGEKAYAGGKIVLIKTGDIISKGGDVISKGGEMAKELEKGVKKAVFTERGREKTLKEIKKAFTKKGAERIYDKTLDLTREGLEKGADLTMTGIGKGVDLAKRTLTKENLYKGVSAAESGVMKVESVLKKVRVSPDAVIARASSIASATPKALSATYGKEERVATQKVRRLVKAGLGGVFGTSIMQQKFGPAIKGRPSGPSGKYMIEGKPVFEEEYQKWAAQQRALNRLTPSTRQQAPLTSEEQQVQQQRPTDTEQGYASADSPLTVEQIQASKQLQTPQRGPSNEEIKMAQELAQKEDNIMNAPNILKGELKATGGSLLTSTGPQIMDAPNAFKGQLRTLNRGDPASIGEVKVGERPQTNPYGDEYIDIELGSGRPVLKKRPSEKWMTGEAL